MKKLTRYLFAFSFFVNIISCKKDSASSNGSGLVGNWKFVSIHAKTSTTNQYEDQGDIYKTITNSDYTSTDNAGTAAITANTMVSTGITYTVSTDLWAYEYTNNILIDSFSSPFNITIPPSNSSSTYKVVGTDSIYFEGQSFFSSDPNSGVTSKSGAKFSISGNTLTIFANLVKDTTMDEGGLSVHEHETADVVSTMQRQ